MSERRKVLNTPFETGLRIVLLLQSTGTVASLDRIIIYDFIATHADSFNLGDEPLNGSTLFAFGELPARRRLAENAMKELILDGFADAQNTMDGIVYSISPAGRELCRRLQSGDGTESEYIVTYTKMVQRIHRRYRRRTVAQLANEVTKYSMKSIKKASI